MQGHRQCVGTMCKKDPGKICITWKDLNQGPKARRILKPGLRAWVKWAWVGLSLTKRVSPEAKLVHGNGKVAGLVTTTV